MHPNLIHVDWERTFAAPTMVVILALLVERALAMLFDAHLHVAKFDRDGVKHHEVLSVYCSPQLSRQSSPLRCQSSGPSPCCHHPTMGNTRTQRDSDNGKNRP